MFSNYNNMLQNIIEKYYLAVFSVTNKDYVLIRKKAN